MIKILLVEDDKSLREIYGVRLLAEGYDIVSAGDGEAALAMAIKEQPQLIISDVMMPKISGFDMLDILRSTTETRNIKVIMMTALSSEDQRARGQALGADRYLVKSQVGIEDVVRAVHEVLGDTPGAAPSAAPQQSAPAPQPNTQQQNAPQPQQPRSVAPVPARPLAPAAPLRPPTPSFAQPTPVAPPPIQLPQAPVSSTSGTQNPPSQASISREVAPQVAAPSSLNTQTTPLGNTPQAATGDNTSDSIAQPAPQPPVFPDVTFEETPFTPSNNQNTPPAAAA